MISRLYIGIDVSKNWFDVFYFIDKQPTEARFANKVEGHLAFTKSILELAKRAHVCLEHTGGYETALALVCKDAGLTVSLVDGAKIAHYRRSFSASGASTDRRSAYLLARYCRERKPEQWFPLPDEYRKFRELVRHRERLIQNKTEWCCRAAHVVEDELVAAHRRTIIEVLRLQIDECEKRIAQHVKAHSNLKDAVRLLDTIPGVAFTSACRIVAETGPIENYLSAKSYALAAGLAPIVIHSGQNTPPGRLPVYGNRELRCGLYFPAVVCFGKSIGVYPFMRRVASNGAKLKMTVITAGMRKLAHVIYGILASGKPFDPDRIGPVQD